MGWCPFELIWIMFLTSHLMPSYIFIILCFLSMSSFFFFLNHNLWDLQLSCDYGRLYYTHCVGGQTKVYRKIKGVIRVSSLFG